METKFSKKFNSGLLLGMASILVGLIGWQLLIWLAIFNTSFLPSPIDVLNAFASLFQNGTFVVDVYSSILRVFLGFLLGTLTGLILAALNSYSATMNKITSPWIEVLRPIPPLAWIPLSILFFGLGDKPAIFLVSLGSFFPVYTNAYDAIKKIPEKYLHTAKMMGVDTKLLLLDVIIPSTLPRIVTGLKIGLGISWMIVITAELVGATSGLGYFIELNRLLLQVDKVIVGMLVIGSIGFLMNRGISKVENMFAHYRAAI